MLNLSQFYVFWISLGAWASFWITSAVKSLNRDVRVRKSTIAATAATLENGQFTHKESIYQDQCNWGIWIVCKSRHTAIKYARARISITAASRPKSDATLEYNILWFRGKIVAIRISGLDKDTEKIAVSETTWKGLWSNSFLMSNMKMIWSLSFFDSWCYLVLKCQSGQSAPTWR